MRLMYKCKQDIDYESKLKRRCVSDIKLKAVLQSLLVSARELLGDIYA